MTKIEATVLLTFMALAALTAGMVSVWHNPGPVTTISILMWLVFYKAIGVLWEYRAKDEGPEEEKD